MRPKAEWAIDSEGMRARGIIIVLVKSTGWSRNIETRHPSLGKAIQLPLFWFSKSGLFTTSGL